MEILSTGRPLLVSHDQSSTSVLKTSASALVVMNFVSIVLTMEFLAKSEEGGRMAIDEMLRQDFMPVSHCW